MQDDDAIMEIGDVERAIRWQAEHATRNGAPCTARLLLGFVPLLDCDLAVSRRMRSWPGLTLEDAMPLRVAGGLHWLHLAGAEARLAPIYSGDIKDQATVDEIVAVMRHPGDDRHGWRLRAMIVHDSDGAL